MDTVTVKIIVLRQCIELVRYICYGDILFRGYIVRTQLSSQYKYVNNSTQLGFQNDLQAILWTKLKLELELLARYAADVTKRTMSDEITRTAGSNSDS